MPFCGFILALGTFFVFVSSAVALLILTVFIDNRSFGDFVVDLKLEAPIAVIFSVFSLFGFSVTFLN